MLPVDSMHRMHLYKMQVGLLLTFITSDRDFSIMNKTVVLAKENGVLVGAHPSLPDRQGFGRREMTMDPVRI